MSREGHANDERWSDPGTIDRIAFFGTPEFALPTLDALLAAGRIPQVVVSQPTRGAGRGQHRLPPAVAAWAAHHGVDLIQTDRVRDPQFLDRLRSLRLDLAVVVAFGQIFRPELLDLPRLGCMNLHASLLPRYRGASPIVAAIRAGDEQTGATTMLMERGLDSGPLLVQRPLAIGPNETAGELAPRLAKLGGELVVETLSAWEQGGLRPREQDHQAASQAPMLDRSDGLLDWSQPAAQLHDLVRAFDPWPGTRTLFRGELLLVKRTVLAPTRSAHQATPGVFLEADEDALWVAAGDGHVLGLTEVQRPGRRSVSFRDFKNAEQPKPGEQLAIVSRELVDG